MTEHPGEDFTGGELDEPLVDDLLDETRRPDEDGPLLDDRPVPDPAGDAAYPHDPPGVPEPPD
jgi:hypothetical protein